MNIGTLTIEMAANIVRLQKDMDDAKRLVDRSTRDIEKMANMAKNALGAIGVGLSAAAFGAFIKSSIDAQDQLDKLKQKTGMAATELAGLKFAAEQNDTSLNGVAAASKKLATTLAENPALMRQLGITATSSTGALVQLSDVFWAMPDGIDKTALAVKLMGKSGEEMIPFLNNGSAALKELIAQGKEYNPVTEESVRQAAEFNDNLDKLKASASGLGVQLSSTMLKPLQQISEAMAQAARDGGLLKAAWVGLGGVGAALFTDDMLSREEKVAKRLREINELQSSGRALPGALKRAAAEKSLLEAEMAQIRVAAEEMKRIDAEKAKAEDERKAKMTADVAARMAQAKAEEEAAKALKKSKEEATKAEKKAKEDAIVSQQEWMSGIGKTTEQLINEANAAEYNNSLIGKTAVEIAILTSARYDEQIAAAEAQAVMLQNIPSRKAEYDLVLMQIDALQRLQKAKGSESILRANADSAQQAANDYKKVGESLNDSLTGAISRSFTTGSSLAQNFANSVQSIFSDMVLQPVVKAMVTSGLGAVGLGATGSALAGTAGGAATGTAAGAVAGGSSIGSMAAAVAPYAIAAVGVYALAKYGFGWGNTRENVGDQRLVGQFNRSGFSGNYQQDWKVDGGWFGSDQRGTDITAINSVQGRAFKATVDSLQSTFNGLGVAIGDTSLRTRDWKVNVNQAGDVTGTLADSMGMQLIPSLEKFQLTGESLAQTAQRLTGVFQGTSYFITALGLDSQQAFGAFGIQSAAQRDALIKSFSGDTFDKQTADFNSKVSGFVQNFLTAADQLNPSLDAVGRTFSELKITGISTNQQFADRVKLELQAGNTDTVARLLNVADAFNTITASAEKSRAELAALVNANSFSTLADFQRAQAYAANGSGASGGAASMIASATASGGVALGNDQAAADTARRIAEKASALAALNTVKGEKDDWQYEGDARGQARSKAVAAHVSAWNAEHNARVAAAQAAYDSLPAFASGGLHTGGLRLVGERGPELEYTGPSRIFSNSQSQSLLDTSGLLEELKQMRTQLKSLVENQVRDNSAIKTAVQATADLLDRNTGGGGPMLVTTA